MMSTSLAYWFITSWAQDSCCSFKAERRNKQQRTMPEIPLPCYLESKSFLRSFLLTNKPSFKCCGKLYFSNMVIPIYIVIPSHMFLLHCDRYFFNWEIVFCPFKSGRVLVDSLNQQSIGEVMLSGLRGRVTKRIQLPSGALSLGQLSEPSDHVETTSAHSSWAPSRHKH